MDPKSRYPNNSEKASFWGGNKLKIRLKDEDLENSCVTILRATKLQLAKKHLWNELRHSSFGYAGASEEELELSTLFSPSWNTCISLHQFSHGSLNPALSSHFLASPLRFSIQSFNLVKSAS